MLSPPSHANNNDVEQPPTSNEGCTIVEVENNNKQPTSPYAILAYLVGWFVLSTVSSTTTKDLLDKFSRPITLTMAQLGITIVYCFLTAVLKRTARKNSGGGGGCTSVTSWGDCLFKKTIWYIAVLRLGTKLFHKMALIHVPVSFVHTVKVSSPIFMIIASRIMIGEVAPPRLVLSVIPIVLGVGLCTISETNFNTYGLVEALLSVLFFVIASILTKKTLEEQPQLDKIEFILYSDVATLACMIPMWVIFEGFSVTEDLLHIDVLYLLLINGISQVGQTLFAFYVLVSVTSLSFGVLSVSKRIFVIASSVIYFGNFIGLWNQVGMILAFGGVLLFLKTKYDLQVQDSMKNGEKEQHVKIELDLA